MNKTKFRLCLLIAFLFAYKTASAQSKPTGFPRLEIINGDSCFCFSLSQAREIDKTFVERDFFKKQYGEASVGLEKCRSIFDQYEQVIENQKKDIEYWKKINKRQKREKALVGATVGTVAAGLLVTLIILK